LILLGDIFKKFRSFGQMLRDRLSFVNWLISAMNQILLSQLQQEVSAELDVKINVAGRRFGLSNMQIQSLI
jgi:hypothetical protein